MLAHPIQLTQVPKMAAILQLNCQQPSSISLSLFNNEDIDKFLFLDLHYLPVNTHTNRPHKHHGWLMNTHPSRNLQEYSHARTCIYVKKKLQHVVEPISIQTHKFSACTGWISDFEMLLVNMSHQPGTFKGFDAREKPLKSLPSSSSSCPPY